MATQPIGGRYEVVVWDYHQESDSEAEERMADLDPERKVPGSIKPYFEYRRHKGMYREEAFDYAESKVENDLRVGAAVFLDGKLVAGMGIYFPYQEKYW